MEVVMKGDYGRQTNPEANDPGQDVPEYRSLARFLATGELGPLKPTFSLEEVYALLGEPNEVGRPHKGTAHDNLEVLFYNNLDITFLEGKIATISVVFGRDDDGLPAALRADWYERVRAMVYGQFVGYLRDHGIRWYRAVDDFLEDDILLFLFPNGFKIEIGFGAEDGYRIHKVLLSTLGPGPWQLEECS
jgi:hypothetical protein